MLFAMTTCRTNRIESANERTFLCLPASLATFVNKVCYQRIQFLTYKRDDLISEHFWGKIARLRTIQKLRLGDSIAILALVRRYFYDTFH